jgi:hypothetical protein
MEALQDEDLCLSVRVAGGVRALQPMHFATKEEEEQAREEYYAAVEKYDCDAAEDAIYGTSPPGGIISPLSPGDWGHVITLVVRDRHLLIEWLIPTFPPESYSFAIANPKAVDELLTAAFPAQTSIKLIEGADWIAAEAKQMKKDEEIPKRISDFARALAGRMETAAATNTSIKPLKWTYIKNQLHNWGLWPASKIE